MSTAVTDFLTPEQAAKFLGVSMACLAQWRSKGKYNLPFTKLGGRIRYRQADLEKFLKERTVTSTQAKSL